MFMQNIRRGGVHLRVAEGDEILEIKEITRARGRGWRGEKGVDG